jgi:hypothetical protein
LASNKIRWGNSHLYYVVETVFQLFQLDDDFVLGGVYISTTLANIDTCKSPGVYFVNGTSGDAYTTDDSIMRVSLAQYLSDDNTRMIIQERFPKNYNKYMIRKYYQNSWSDWQIIE